MSNFFKKVTWQGVVTGFAAALVLGMVLSKGRR